MTRHSVEITPGTPAFNSRIAVDGHDISAAVRRLTLDIDCGNALPEISLELGFVEVPSFAANEAEIVLNEPTRDALLKLGWSPPPEEP